MIHLLLAIGVAADALSSATTEKFGVARRGPKSRPFPATTG
jgi:hypothetical protein